GGVIVVDTLGEANTLTAYDEQGQQRWTTVIDAVADGVGTGFLMEPVAAFDLENDLVMIGSRAAPGIIGLDLSPEGAIAHLDAQGHVHAVRAEAVDADSDYVPRLLVGESSVVVAVKRSAEPVWDLWAIERSQVGAAGAVG